RQGATADHKPHRQDQGAARTAHAGRDRRRGRKPVRARRQLRLVPGGIEVRMRRKVPSKADAESARPRASDMATPTMEPAKVLVDLSAQAPKRLHPVASRRRLTAKLFDTLCADFEAHGADAIRACRADQPQGYLRLIASLLPNELDRNDNPLKDIPDDEL